MPDEPDVVRVARAMVIIGKLRTAALSAMSSMPAEEQNGSDETKAILRAHADHLFEVFPQARDASSLLRHIAFNMRTDYDSMIYHDLPSIEASLAKWAETARERPRQAFGFEDLLHPLITRHCLPLYADGHPTEAVRNAYLALFDEIRRKSGQADDGANLVATVFSLSKPILTLSDLSTETGRSQQKGFIQILQGVFQAYRNPLAHSGAGSLRVSSQSAARHLIFVSSLLGTINRSKRSGGKS